MSPPRARLVVVGLGVVALAAAGAFVALTGSGAPDAAPTPDPTPTEAVATPTPPPASSPSPAPTPTAEAEAEAEAEPGADPSPPPANGSRVVTQDADPVDPDGAQPPDPEASAVLEAAAVEVDGDELVATLELGAPPPARTDALLLWSIELADDEGELLTTISVQQEGARHVAAAYDWATGEQAPLDPDAVSVDGDDLRVHVPTSALPDLGAIAGWAASAHLDGAWETRVPGDAHDPDAPFEPLAR